MEPIYSERFVKGGISNNPKTILHVIDLIKEVHSERCGWVVGDPSIIPSADGKTVSIEVDVTKYDIKKAAFVR